MKRAIPSPTLPAVLVVLLGNSVAAAAPPASDAGEAGERWTRRPIGLEASIGFTFRGYLGLAHSWTEDCYDSTRPPGNPGTCYSIPLLPYAGVALGHAFEI